MWKASGVVLGGTKYFLYSVTKSAAFSFFTRGLVPDLFWEVGAARRPDLAEVVIGWFFRGRSMKASMNQFCEFRNRVF